MNMQLPLDIRYKQLVAFRHSRHEPELTDEQIAALSGVDVTLLAAVRNGKVTALSPHDADAIATSLGLEDGSYLRPLDTPGLVENAEVMHEKLQMYIEARALGVQRIAARDTSDSPRLVGWVRQHLRNLSDRKAI